MKKVYLVRHGQSEGNAGLIRQGVHTSLTKKGREQAEFLAKRCKSLDIQYFVASSMQRALETSEIISNSIKIEAHSSDLFVERRRPKEQIGNPKSDKGSLEIEKIILENFGNENFRFSDEENFFDLKNRARKALEFLELRAEQNILVVTHGFFLRVLAAYVIFGEKLTSDECIRIIKTFPMENTGITVFSQGRDEKNEWTDWSPWCIWTWNDHAHLG